MNTGNNCILDFADINPYKVSKGAKIRNRYNPSTIPDPGNIAICIEIDKFNNTGARMIDSIYHMP